MTMFRKLAVVAATALISLSASASLITVQGVTWDPNSTQPQDFQASSNFAQWFQDGSAFDPGNAAGVRQFTNPELLKNAYVTGAGKFNTVNGVNQIVGQPDPETIPAIFAPGRELTYIYGGIKITNVTVTGLQVDFTVDLTDSYFNVYSDSAVNYSEGGGLAQQVNAANTDLGTPFLTGRFDEFNISAQLLSTSVLRGFADGLISVTGGAALGNFDTNGQQSVVTPGLFADLTFTGSSQIAPGNKISSVSTAEIQGNSIPEPSALALVGLALLSGFAAARKRASKN